MAKKNTKKDNRNQNLRCPIVCVLGHVDHGKCLMPYEKVLTENGSIEIKKLFEMGKETVEKDEKK